MTNLLGKRAGPALPRQGDKQEIVPVYSATRAAYFLNHLVSLLHDDRLYTAKFPAVGPTPALGDLELRILNPFATPLLTVFLKERRLRFHYAHREVTWGIELLLDPIGLQLLNLVREVVPEKSEAARLAYQPLRPAPLVPPAGVPAESSTGCRRYFRGCAARRCNMF